MAVNNTFVSGAAWFWTTSRLYDDPTFYIFKRVPFCCVKLLVRFVCWCLFLIYTSVVKRQQNTNTIQNNTKQRQHTTTTLKNPRDTIYINKENKTYIKGKDTKKKQSTAKSSKTDIATTKNETHKNHKHIQKQRSIQIIKKHINNK